MTLMHMYLQLSSIPSVSVSSVPFFCFERDRDRDREREREREREIGGICTTLENKTIGAIKIFHFILLFLSNSVFYW